MTEPIPPHVARATSVAAARAIQPHRPNIASRIFDYVWTIPSTCEELENRLGLRHQTASARLSELQAAGCLRPSGVTRPSSSLAESDVYEGVPGATFELYEVWRTRNGRTQRTDTTGLVEAARAYAKARHDNVSRDEWEPLAMALLRAAQTTFPNG